MRRIVPFALALLWSLPASAQTRRHTVMDYYKLLPKRFFVWTEKEEPRLQLLRDGLNPKLSPDARSIVDVRNDFLRVVRDSHGSVTLAVFRYHGQETLAVFDDFEEGELSFWKLSNGRLREVTKSAFPFRLPHSSSVQLPRRGTTIRVLRGNGYDVPQSKVVFGNFVWRQGRFLRVAR